MNRHVTLQRCLLTFLVGMLLFVQISGLHHHVHGDAGTPVHSHVSELHFGDAGLHGYEHPAASAHATAAPHAHADVEIKGLGDMLAKLAIDLLPLGLLMLAALLLLPRLVLQIRHRAYAGPVTVAHPFALHPPSNGPPGLSFLLV